MTDTFVSHDEPLKSFEHDPDIAEVIAEQTGFGGPGQPPVGASDEADPDLTREVFAAAAEDLPPVGLPVVFYPRRGMGRMNLLSFPAVVHRVREDIGKIDLLVYFDVEDTMRLERVVRRSETDTEQVWDYIPGTAPADKAPDVAAMAHELEAIRQELSGLRAMLLGDFEEPKVSLFAIFADIEARVKALEKAGINPNIAAMTAAGAPIATNK